MQAVGIPPARHDAAGEGIDDQDFSVLDHIVTVPDQQVVGPQSQIHVVLQLHVLQVRNVVHAEEPFCSADAGLGQNDPLFLFDHNKVAGLLLLHAGDDIQLGKLLQVPPPGQAARQRITGLVKAGGAGALTGDDQRCSGVVDQHRVHLVDDGIVEAALHHLIPADGHIVPQVVEPQLAVCHVCNIAAVGRLALRGIHTAQHGAHRQAQELMDPAHLIRVALCQIIVDRDHMDAFARQRVEIGRQRGHQRLALAGTHLGNAALMQHDAANDLRGEMLHPQHTAAGLPHHGVCLREDVIQGLPLSQTPSEFPGLIA